MFTVLDLGNELKKREDFDKDEYIKALEKEVARFIRNADFHVINHQKMYEELRKTKHALWMARAKRAKERIDFWNEKPKLEPNKGYAINGCKGMKKFSSRKTLQPIEWRNIYMWVECKCLQKAKEYV